MSEYSENILGKHDHTPALFSATSFPFMGSQFSVHFINILLCNCLLMLFFKI